MSKALSCDRLPEEIWCSEQMLVWSLNIKFPREPITHRVWDRTTVLFLLCNTKFLAKIAKNVHYALIGARWGETLSRHVIDVDQWEHAEIKRCTIIGLSDSESPWPGMLGQNLEKLTSK